MGKNTGRKTKVNKYIHIYIDRYIAGGRDGVICIATEWMSGDRIPVAARPSSAPRPTKSLVQGVAGISQG